MHILIGSDHIGYSLKENLKEYLVESGYEVVD
ncbi:MAG: RpiB/LacA/LacB family sugar-phosphate isomerase, partial [Anaerolineaceae bacterium]